MTRRLARAFTTGLAAALGLAAVGNLIDYFTSRDTDPGRPQRSTA